MFFDLLSEYSPGSLFFAVVVAFILRFTNFTTRGWPEAINACIANYRTDRVVRPGFIIATLGKPLIISFGTLLCVSTFSLVGAMLCTNTYPFTPNYMLAIVLLGVVSSVSVFFPPLKLSGVFRSIVEKPLNAGLKAIARRLPTMIRWR